MIDKERIKEAERNVKQYIDDGMLRTKDNHKISGAHPQGTEPENRGLAAQVQRQKCCGSWRGPPNLCDNHSLAQSSAYRKT